MDGAPESIEPPSPHDARVRAAWAAHRPYLLAVAAGMLKRQDDARPWFAETRLLSLFWRVSRRCMT
jgi:hypothetical protein